MGRGYSAGGSLQLAELIDSHGTALYADLRSMGVSLMDLFSSPPKTSPAECLWLIDALPDNAATKRDPEQTGGQWEATTLLLAMVYNALQDLGHMYATAHTEKGKHVPEPKYLLPPSMEATRASHIRSGDDVFF